MAEYIEREKAYELARTSELYSDFHRSMADLTSLKELLEDTPTADVVPSAVLEQVMWERDMALETLKEHGIGFCEKSDMVEVRHGEWIVMEEYKTALSGSRINKIKTYHCPYCKKRFRQRMKFCGECGAKMDGKVD